MTKLADLLEIKVPKGQTKETLQSLRDAFGELSPEFGKVYNSKGFVDNKTGLSFKNYGELKKYLIELGIPSDAQDKYFGIVIENWYENMTKAPEYSEPTTTEDLTKTTLNKDESAQLIAEADKVNAEIAKTRVNAKQAIDKALETQKKIYEERLKQQKSVVVVPTEEIPKVTLTNKEKVILFNLAQAIKLDEATVQFEIQQKMEESLEKSFDDIQKNVSPELVTKASVDLVEKIKPYSAFENASEIPDNIPTLNPASPFTATALFDENSQILALAIESENNLNSTLTSSIFEGSENITMLMYQPQTITRFEVAENQNREDGIQIDPKEVYTEGRRVKNIWDKLSKGRGLEEVYSSVASYVSPYTPSAASAITSEAKSLAIKALPSSANAIYGFRKGVLLGQWTASGTPLLSTGNQQIVKLLSSQAGVREIVSASSVVFSNPVGFQFGNFAIAVNTGKNASAGVQLAAGGIRFGEKYSGFIAFKSGTQATIAKVSSQAGTKVLVGASSTLTKVLTALGATSSWVTAGLGLAVGYVLGKISEKINWAKVKSWITDNGPLLLGAGGLVFFGPAAGAGLLVGGLLVTGGLSGVIAGATTMARLIWLLIVPAIATPLIITLLALPPLVALIVLVINSGAYIVPPSPLTLQLSQDNPYMEVTKKPDTTKIANPRGTSTVVTYTVTISALKNALTNVKITSTKCSVVKKDKSKKNCPPEIIEPLEDGLSVSPASPVTFSFEVAYDASYSDSLVYDSIEVTADTIEQSGITDTGSATVCVGDCPTDCVTVDDPSWASNTSAQANLSSAIASLGSGHQEFMSKVCADGKEVKLCYTTSNPSPIGQAGLCNQAIYARHMHGDCDINFNQCGIKTESNAAFLLTHELTHHVQEINGSSINEYKNSGAFFELLGRGFCSYSATQSDIYEAMAEANGLFVSIPSWGTCATNYKSLYPKNFIFAQKFMGQ